MQGFVKMRKPKKRNINPSRIKTARTYTIHEISKNIGVHKNTIRHWLKDGLKPIDDQRPLLFHGSELRRFISARQISRKQVCAIDEFYCLKCRKPQKAKNGSITLIICNQKTGNLIGECVECGTKINRRISLAKRDKFEIAHGLKKQASSHLIEMQFNSLNCAEIAPNLETTKAPPPKSPKDLKRTHYQQANLFDDVAPIGGDKNLRPNTSQTSA